MPPKRNVSPADEASRATTQKRSRPSSTDRSTMTFRRPKQSSDVSGETSGGRNTRTTRITSYNVVRDPAGAKLIEESQMQRKYTINENKNNSNSNMESELGKESDSTTQFHNNHDDFIPQESDRINDQETDDERDQTSAGKIKAWVPLQSIFLDEFHRHDGKAEYFDKDQCYQCKDEIGLYQCTICMDGKLLRCQSCIVENHAHLPLHKIMKWNEDHLEKDSLRNLGLIIQLGHGGAPCLNPSNHTEMVVVDGTGIYKVEVAFCECGEDFIPHYTQLLRSKWFPASFIRPQTVFTFQGLEQFHEQNFQGKVNLYDWYHGICRLTDKLKLEEEINRYNEFRHVVRLWRFLFMCKRAGRGLFTDGISGTKLGELTVECPACPHPGKNLPENWNDVRPSLKFLYIMYLAVDANFKLSCKDRGIKDIDQMPGWGPYVEEQNYQRHLQSYKETREINTCDSGHDAILQAGIRTAPGHSVTGTALVICARHAFIRKNGAGDLQKGERYCNIDYIILSTLIGTMLSWIMVTYDIGCQWSKNLRKRIEEYPEDMQISPDVKIDVGVPAWHLNAHGSSCRSNFALAYLQGAGRTCGEEVETTWSSSNHLRPSTREMGLSARQELLNDHWNDWNEQKLITLRPQLLKDHEEALIMREKHTVIFVNFSATFKPRVLNELESLLQTWEESQSGDNPYQEPENANALQELRLELFRKETVSFEKGVTPKHKMTLTKFIFVALEIEEQQRALQLELADLQERHLSLATRIRKWQEVQLIYMPDVSTLLTPAIALQNGFDSPTDDNDAVAAELIPIQLPSMISMDYQNYPQTQTVANYELQVRKAQADDALANIRHLRCMISTLWQFKSKNVSGTGNKPNTRMRALYQRFQNKVHLCADRYRKAHTAVAALEPNGDWLHIFKELKGDDIRGPQKDQEDSSSNGNFEISWIWLVPQSNINAENSDEAIHKSLKVEWAKCRARKQRWEEEVLILREEMRRVIRYLEWKADWWKSISDIREYPNTTGEDIKQGVKAYALKQSSLCAMLAQSCIEYWVPTLMKGKETPDWAQSYATSISVITSSGKSIQDENNWENADKNETSSEQDEVETTYPMDRFEIED